MDKQQYLDLIKNLNYHNYRYHVMDAPLISDGEFDRLMKQIQQIEKEQPDWISPDSPTQRAGSPASEKFSKVVHPQPVLSLANAFDFDDVLAWLDRIERIDARVRDSDFVIEPKIDGLTIVLTYEHGMLVQGATRGNGDVGENITANIRTIRGIPLRIPVDPNAIAAPEQLVVRGEIFLRKDDFEKLNELNIQEGGKSYLNPRNTAAGSLRQLNPAVTASRPLKLFTYNILQCSDPELDSTQMKALETLRKLGFPVSPDIEYCQDRITLKAAIDKLAAKRDLLAYEIDGIVIKLNDLRLAAELGSVGKDPRGAVALKFPAREMTTKLDGIGVNVGRTGVLTPYAILSPVEIGGVIVKQATLHNFDFIHERDIRIGDSVMVKRAGDVIPYVIGPIPDLRDGNQVPYQNPKTCPVCGEEVEDSKEEVAIYCINSACPAQLIRNVEHFASRGAMDIEGLGIKIVELIVNDQLVADPADIYSLTKENLLKLEGFADKKAENLLAAIENSKKQPLNRVINALGIRGVGEVMAETLASEFKSIDNLAAASYEVLTEIEGIGPRVGTAILDWFANEKNHALIQKLKQAGIKLEVTEKSPASTTDLPLNGKIIVVTGTLANFTRESIKETIQQNGGKNSDSVSKNTDFVLVGENPGSKLTKAQSLGIQIIDEETFLMMINLK
ncbi:MAG: NAD-dependent DNA ligase LigA [Chloroflexi bacterium]|nr:NAD-dependent DNA ligase LigA [Chloroflexota bacterium]